tara:strand:+ start:389 stop:682 length:294 start_codon:yes stop_codon:yes gene_type:complete
MKITEPTTHSPISKTVETGFSEACTVYEYDNDFHPILLKDVPRGMFFVVRPTPRLDSNVMTREEYDRTERKYWVQGWNNSRAKYIKGTTKVYIGFTY